MWEPWLESLTEPQLVVYCTLAVAIVAEVFQQDEEFPEALQMVTQTLVLVQYRKCIVALAKSIPNSNLCYRRDGYWARELYSRTLRD